MTPFLEKLAARRRFGMRQGLDEMRRICRELGDPGRCAMTIHVAGTNGKGAVAAILDSALRSAGFRTFRYTSPHLLRLNERFCIDGNPAPDGLLDRLAKQVEQVSAGNETTFFEALTAVAFLAIEETKPDFAILETGLGGRLDATNVCRPVLTVVTKIGLDHCEWLGGTVPEIAAEKAGIAKPGVPLVIGRNDDEARDMLERRARKTGALPVYAPDIASLGEIPPDFSLSGSFNRENAVTALAALKTLFAGTLPPHPLGTLPKSAGKSVGTLPKSAGTLPKSAGTLPLTWPQLLEGFSKVVWPGRFQKIANFIVDGAHNPPAAHALAAALRQEIYGDTPPKKRGDTPQKDGQKDGDTPLRKFNLVAGFCGDKDIDKVLRILAPFVMKGYAVRSANPRSLAPEEVSERMKLAGIDAIPCNSLKKAINLAGSVPTDSGTVPSGGGGSVPVLICGSLFLAGETLAFLNAYPWPAASSPDPSELLQKVSRTAKQRGI